jgi:hypothetical protein
MEQSNRTNLEKLLKQGLRRAYLNEGPYRDVYASMGRVGTASSDVRGASAHMCDAVIMDASFEPQHHFEMRARQTAVLEMQYDAICYIAMSCT